MKKIRTVTIGIPAYNEEQNIAGLLQSVVNQRTKGFTVSKIIVNSDGSSDRTDAIVDDMNRIDPRISLHRDGKRKGKMRRLMELYHMNTSDIFVQLDADIVLADRYVLIKILRPFADETVTVVSGNNQPSHAVTYIQKLMNTWYVIWYHMRRDINGGDYIQNLHSCAMAVRRDFLPFIRLPYDFTSDGQYMYCLLKKLNRKFVFADNAIVRFKLPATLHDCVLLVNRGPDEQKRLQTMFGSGITEYSVMNLWHKAFVLGKELLRHPIDATSAFCFSQILDHMPKDNTHKAKNGLFETLTSTKNLSQGGI